MTTPSIQQTLRHDGQVLHLLLDRPKANILDLAMIGALSEALSEQGRRPSLKAIVFEGAGNHFSFGASVEEHQKSQVRAMLPRFHALFNQLLDLGVPTVAVVRGQCLGGGMELAAFCTWIFASERAAFGQPESQLGVFPPLASVLLPWRVGGGHAADLCVSGRSITAAEAHRIGLVHSVSEDPSASAEAFLLEHLLPKSASSLRFTERAARLRLADLFRTDLPRCEALYLDELMESEDANEGIAAFIERRKPAFGKGAA